MKSGSRIKAVIGSMQCLGAPEGSFATSVRGSTRSLRASALADPPKKTTRLVRLGNAAAPSQYFSWSKQCANQIYLPKFHFTRNNQAAVRNQSSLVLVSRVRFRRQLITDGMQGSFSKERPILPGQTRKVGLIFLTPEGEQAIRNAHHFFLWKKRIIGKATVCNLEPDPSR